MVAKIYLGAPPQYMTDWIDRRSNLVVDSSKPVKFRNCDGAVLRSYTADEVAGMTKLPALPTKPGLTCQGWNWTLQQIKDYVAEYGKCEVGATYTTDDGKTRIKITIQDPKYATIPIVFQQSVEDGVKVNWGDDPSTYQTYSGTSQQTISHAYAPSAYPATYTITFEVTSGTMSFPSYIMGKSGAQSSSNPVGVWTTMIREVNIGEGVTRIGTYAFRNCYSLDSITMPNSVTSIGNSAFYGCSSLASITIPSSVTSVPQYAFYQCYSLDSITMPDSATGIDSSAFYQCYSLASITMPSSVTSVPQYAFYQCYSLDSITMPDSVTSIGNEAFYQCLSLASVTIPSSVTSIGSNVFQRCYSLASITIPSSVTSIGSKSIGYCYSLASITIPSSVTIIEDSAFMDCYGLKTFDFRRSASVPTLANVNAFQNTPTVKEIVVPDDLYDDWIAATNWNSTTNQISTGVVKASESSLGPLN